VKPPGYFRFLCCLFVSAAILPAQSHVAADLARQVLSASLDPEECYRIHEIQIHEADVTLYLTEGYLIFGKPVNGAPVSAVFTTEGVDGGDGEVVLLPPDRAERRTLATFTQTPNLDQHFTQAIFFFTDKTARAIAEQVRSSSLAQKDPSLGLLITSKWNLSVTSFAANFETRIVLDLMTTGPQGQGFFYATLRGRTLGDFDIVNDARSSEQVTAGRVALRDGLPQWETWTRFAASNRRSLPAPAPEEEILSYTIDASMDSTLAMHCVTRMQIRATLDSTDVLPFELDSAMRPISAKVDGMPAEVYRHDSAHDGLTQGSPNELFIVIPPHQLAPGSTHEIEIVHDGNVVRNTGNEIFSVSARGTWYPGRGAQFAAYDATWHYPENLNLVSAGVVTEDRVANGIHTTHRIAQGKLRLLGFNLGRYNKRDSEKNGVTISVSANRNFEPALRPPPPPPVIVPPPDGPSHALKIPQVLSPAPLPQDPSDRVDAISNETLAAIDFFRARFGDPPLKHIEISPVPGRFGQGFAGMIYLPTLTYMNPADIPQRINSPFDEAFMSQLLRIHEIAHQWWGNIVSTNSYHHEWLMESLANYSALMYLEHAMGPKAVEKALDVYRGELTAKGPDGTIVEASGPVVDGRRLESSTTAAGANAVMYGKGTWIIHMLRRRMGDAAFLKMLAELRRRYEFRTITTEGFRSLCAEFLPSSSGDSKLNDFFDQWVYDTGMPTLKLTYTLTGTRLTGTITQTDAPDDFTVTIPVEIRTSAGKTITRQVRTSSGAVKFSADAVGPGAKATLDPGWSILRR
jgi:hypothetical protein